MRRSLKAAMLVAALLGVCAAGLGFGWAQANARHRAIEVRLKAAEATSVAQVEKLSSDLVKAQADSAADHRRLEAQLDVSNSHVEQLKQSASGRKLSELQAELEARNHEVARLEKELASARDEASRLLGDVGRLRELEAAVQARDNEITSLNKKLESEQARSAELEKQLRQVKAVDRSTLCEQWVLLSNGASKKDIRQTFGAPSRVSADGNTWYYPDGGSIEFYVGYSSEWQLPSGCR